MTGPPQYSELRGPLENIFLSMFKFADSYKDLPHSMLRTPVWCLLDAQNSILVISLEVQVMTVTGIEHAQCPESHSGASWMLRTPFWWSIWRFRWWQLQGLSIFRFQNPILVHLGSSELHSGDHPGGSGHDSYRDGVYSWFRIPLLCLLDCQNLILVLVLHLDIHKMLKSIHYI